MLFIKDLPPESTVGPAGRREPSHLLRRAVERLRLREDQARRSSTTRRATTTSSATYDGSGGVPVGGSSGEAAVRHPLPARSRSLLQRRPHRREPGHASTAGSRERVAAHRAVPDLRPRSRTWSIADGPAVLDPGRLHDQQPLSLLDAGRATASTTSATRSRSSIDAYHGTTRVLPGRPERSDRATLRRRSSRACSSRSPSMPADLRRALRYPEDIFALQARDVSRPTT